jgi:hypothetical protein
MCSYERHLPTGLVGKASPPHRSFWGTKGDRQKAGITVVEMQGLGRRVEMINWRWDENVTPFQQFGGVEVRQMSLTFDHGMRPPSSLFQTKIQFDFV